MKLEDHCLLVTRMDGRCVDYLIKDDCFHRTQHILSLIRMLVSVTNYQQIGKSDIVAGDKAGVKESHAPSHGIHFLLEECELGISVFLSEGQNMWE